MIRSGMLAILALVFATSPCSAQFGGGFQDPRTHEDWTVKIETDGGQEVTGTLLLHSVVIDCELGRYEIKPEKVKSIRISRQEGEPTIENMDQIVHGSVVLGQNEEMSGIVHIPNTWRIITELGILTLNPKTLKAITFIGKVETHKSQPSFQ